MALAPIVALDIGTSQIRVLVGEPREDQGIDVLGMGVEPSCGVRKSEIVDFDNALISVKSALQQAEESSDVSIRSIYLLLTGGHIESVVNHGTVPIMDASREIDAHHMNDVARAARRANLGEKREIVHTVNQYYSVDDQEGVVSPEGMEGQYLGLNVIIIHGAANRIRNRVKVASTVPLDVDDVAYSGLCSGLSVLTPDQKESGVLLVDLGGGSTDIILYAPRYLAFAQTLGVGGEHVTNDIAIGLKLPTRQAERLKREHGSAIADHSLRGKSVSLPADGGFAGKTVKLLNLNTIINARMEETFRMIRRICEDEGALQQIGSGVVLTGGGAMLDGAERLAEKVFNMPVTVAQPHNVSGLDTVAMTPEYAAATGMLRYGMMAERQGSPGGISNIFKRLLGKS